MTSPIKTETHIHRIWDDEGEEVWMTDAEYQADQAECNATQSRTAKILAKKHAATMARIEKDREWDRKIKQAWADSKRAPLASNVNPSEDGYNDRRAVREAVAESMSSIEADTLHNQ